MPRPIVETTFLATMVALALLVGGSRPAAGQAARLDGTLLTVPVVTHDGALLRVSGPERYGLVKVFPPGSPLAVDLLTDSSRLDAGPVGAPGAGGGLSHLAPGRYRYEVVLGAGSGPPAVYAGRFDIGRDEAPDHVLGGTASSADRPAAESLTVDNFITIEDSDQDGTTVLRLESFNNPPDEDDWLLQNNHGDIRLGTALGASSVTHLFVASDGDMGFGTEAPAGRLHAADAGFQLVLDDSAGNVHFFNQTSTALRVGRAGLVFPFILRNDAPDSSLVIDSAGVGIGTASPSAPLHVDGGAIIEGDVAMGSSRSVKHEIAPVDTAAVLAAVRALPVYVWKYRGDPDQATHVGPMAEDIHETFGVGRDDRHLSPADSAGLALAAVQELDGRLRREIVALRTAHADLVAENARLRQRLDAIEGSLPPARQARLGE